MKKISPLLLIAICTMFLSSCSSTQKPPTQQPANNTENTKPAESTNKYEPAKNNELASPLDANKKNEESKPTETTNTKNDSLQQFNNTELGFSLQYPSRIVMIGSGQTQSPDLESLKIETKEIGKSQNPGDLSPEDEAKNIQALAAGQYGLDIDWPYAPSKKARPVGFLFAQDNLVLSRFEVCNVTLERKLLFYHNNQQITITLYAPTNKLKASMSDYFAVDTINCGNEKIWDFNKQGNFYNQLTAGTASPEIQQWYKDFDQIADSIVFTNK